MLRLPAVCVQQLRCNQLITDPMPQSSLPVSPKDIRSRGPVVETYEGKQKNPDDAVLPMPPHKLPLDLLGDLARLGQSMLNLKEIIQQQKFDFKEALMMGKDNFKEEFQKKTESGIFKMQNGIKNAIDLLKRGF
ncbi:uncharacterized protein LOC108151397 [Drosophila miranda]|uniref:uncharacterized protein LOC108151397 n=1 Tax=Drosophila miranda TaxID=7229 RepID=UPI0007E869AC|nr:uncharacterized protein LOC108151397 [Drosophila miranda]XP_017135483.1 uncharacterized protein LOC108151397 [Drosophila miranda]